MQGGFGKIYTEIGVDKYYIKNGDQYINPHRYDIERLVKKKLCPNNPFLRQQDHILDLACGSGEITLSLKQMGYSNITGIDPYTHVKYEQMTGLKCRQLTFVDIVNGDLDE
jgi:ubiquinone/menaquinone biosynthesis C-methylase UbiE